MSNLSHPTSSDRLDRADTGRESTTHAVADDAATPAEVSDELTRGRSPATPFKLLGSVALAVWSVVALICLAALLVWWLA